MFVQHGINKVGGQITPFLSPEHAVDVGMMEEEDRVERRRFVFAHVTIGANYL